MEANLHAIQTEFDDVAIICDVTEVDVVSPGAGVRRSGVRLSEEEYLVVLVTVNLNKCRDHAIVTLSQVRRELKTYEDTSGLLVELLGHRCGIAGFLTTNFTMQEDDVAATWKPKTIQTDLEKFLVDEQVASLRCMDVYLLSDDEAQPSIVVALYDASHPDWWNVKLLALRA